MTVGASKVIKALWLHEIVQLSMFLMKGGAQIVDVQTIWAVTRIGV